MRFGLEFYYHNIATFTSECWYQVEPSFFPIKVTRNTRETGFYPSSFTTASQPPHNTNINTDWTFYLWQKQHSFTDTTSTSTSCSSWYYFTMASFSIISILLALRFFLIVSGAPTPVPTDAVASTTAASSSYWLASVSLFILHHLSHYWNTISNFIRFNDKVLRHLVILPIRSSEMSRTLVLLVMVSQSLFFSNEVVLTLISRCNRWHRCHQLCHLLW